MSQEFSDRSDRPTHSSILSNPGVLSIIRLLDDEQAAILVRTGLDAGTILSVYQEVEEDLTLFMEKVVDSKFVDSLKETDDSEMKSVATKLSPLEENYTQRKATVELAKREQVLALGLALAKWSGDALKRKALFSGIPGEGVQIAQHQQSEYDRVADELDWFFDEKQLATREEIGELMES